MSDNNKKDTVKLSCYVDRKTYESFKKNSAVKGLSISAYLRYLIKKEDSK